MRHGEVYATLSLVHKNYFNLINILLIFINFLFYYLIEEELDTIICINSGMSRL